MYHLSDQQIRQQIDKMFLRYDTDHSNTLDPSQLAPFLNQIFDKTNYPSHVSNIQEAKQLLSYIDINHDGTISKSQIFNVFKYLITSSAEINGINMNQYQNQNQNKYYQENSNKINYNSNQFYGYGQQQYSNPYHQHGGNSQSYGNNIYSYNHNQGQYGSFNNKNPYGNQQNPSENLNPYRKKSQEQDIHQGQPYFSNNTMTQSHSNNSSNQAPNILEILANSLRSNNMGPSQSTQNNYYEKNYSKK